MDVLQKERFCARLAELGYAQENDGTFRVDVPLRALTPEELEQIFYGEAALGASPRLRFDTMMEQLATEELTALAKKVSDPPAPAEDLAALVSVRMPVQAHLQQRCRCDIGVDNGDAGWDYTANTVAPSYDGILNEQYHLPDEASIVWLTRQQGHKKRELADALYHVKKKRWPPEGYIRSTAYEVWNEFSSMNQLCFLLELPLEQILLIQTAVEWHRRTRKWPGYIILDRHTRTGFFDSWNGSGSSLDIKLEKDVKLPIKYIACAIPDSVQDRYSVYSVYETEQLWRNGRLMGITLPKAFRRDAAALVFASLAELCGKTKAPEY